MCKPQSLLIGPRVIRVRNPVQRVQMGLNPLPATWCPMAHFIGSAHTKKTLAFGDAQIVVDVLYLLQVFDPDEPPVPGYTVVPIDVSRCPCCRRTYQMYVVVKTDGMQFLNMVSALEVIQDGFLALRLQHNPMGLQWHGLALHSAQGRYLPPIGLTFGQLQLLQAGTWRMESRNGIVFGTSQCEVSRLLGMTSFGVVILTAHNSVEGLDQSLYWWSELNTNAEYAGWDDDADVSSVENDCDSESDIEDEKQSDESDKTAASAEPRVGSKRRLPGWMESR